MYWVIKKPVTTEKTKLLELSGLYTFMVDAKATKIDVKKAFESIYGVTPKSVQILNTREKHKIGKTRQPIKKRGVERKAMVRLEKEIPNLTKVK